MTNPEQCGYCWHAHPYDDEPCVSCGCEVNLGPVPDEDLDRLLDLARNSNDRVLSVDDWNVVVAVVAELRTCRAKIDAK